LREGGAEAGWVKGCVLTPTHIPRPGGCVGWGGVAVRSVQPSRSVVRSPRWDLDGRTGRGGADWWFCGGWKSQELHDLVLLLARKPSLRRDVSEGFVFVQ
jgi:hypothetical protein